MRIIAGTAKGLKLTTAQGHNTRPTTDRVKEAIFSSIHFELVGAKCLDAFAGSGALGIEALSRGSDFVDFIEPSKSGQQAILDNLNRADLSAFARLHCMDIERYISTRKLTSSNYDIVFLDPPYGKGYIKKTIDLLITNDILKTHTIIIIEHNYTEAVEEMYGNFIKTKEKKYGSTYISTYRSKTYENSNLSREF